jgi:hypothetical protein
MISARTHPYLGVVVRPYAGMDVSMWACTVCFYRFSDYCMAMVEKDTLMICAVFRPLKAAAVQFRARSSVVDVQSLCTICLK